MGENLAMILHDYTWGAPAGRLDAGRRAYGEKKGTLT